eukprot:297677-Heterocapsa_arctica.AAC.1
MKERHVNLSDGGRHFAILRVIYHEQRVLCLTPRGAAYVINVGEVRREGKPTESGRRRPNFS